LTEINVVPLFSASRHEGVCENVGAAPRIINLGAAGFSFVSRYGNLGLSTEVD